MMVVQNRMARFRRDTRRPIHSVKHIVNIQGGLVAGTQVLDTLSESVDAPVLANVTEVETGSTINALFINIQVAATATAALANVYFALGFNRGNNVTWSNLNIMGASDEKRNLLHNEMVMTEKNTTAIPRTLFKGVLKIPKGMRSQRIDDELQAILFAPGVSFDYCIQCIYKEFR